MLSGYFDIRERRRERAETRVENERARREQAASAERRHREMPAMIAATIASGPEMVAPPSLTPTETATTRSGRCSRKSPASALR